LQGKTEHTLSLFRHFTKQYRKIGKVTVHPTKTMIAFAAKTRMVYIIRPGKDFIDILFPLTKPYPDNLCFHEIAQVPGSQQFNDHFRMCLPGDLNDEVRSFMELAYRENSPDLYKHKNS